MNVDKEFYDDMLNLNPIIATYIGDYRYEDKYMHPSTNYYEQELRILIKKYKPITKYSKYAELMKYQLKLIEDSLSLPFKYLAVNHLKNPFKEILDSIPRTQLATSTSALRNFKTRINKMISAVQEIKQVLLEGSRKGITENDKLIAILIKDLRNISIDTRHIKDKKSYKKFMNNVFVQAAHDFANFLEQEYIRHCRKSLGLCKLPHGKEMYLYSLNYNTDCVNYDTMIKLAIKEVKKISKEMEGIKGIKGIKGIVEKIKKDKYKNGEILKDYKNKVKQLEQMNMVTIPTNYKSPQIIGFKKEYEPLANAWPPTLNNEKPAMFKLNLQHSNFYRPDTLGLCAHEAFPGHGFQLQSVMTNTVLPNWVRVSGYNSTIEGWALYCEGLVANKNNELEYYSSLNSRLLRALRVILDICIHVYGLTYDECMYLMKKYLYIPESEMVTEIYRYSALPGQACSYLIGAILIENMASKFTDKKQFHDLFISKSYLPISMIIKEH
jgi:uncharacterized protein (DUF885 family)